LKDINGRNGATGEHGKPGKKDKAFSHMGSLRVDKYTVINDRGLFADVLSLCGERDI
jgi:hypothetical protein